MVKVTVQPRLSTKKGGKPGRPAVEIDFPSRHPNAVTVDELKGAVEAKFPKLLAVRQRLTTETNSVLADGEKSLGSYGVKEEDTVYLKDLGPQISWRTVFVIEYLGPLIIHPIFFFFRNQIFGLIFSLIGERMVPYETSEMQRVAFALITFHFLKREYETLAVHRFSNATMPFRNVFKNSAHYHLLSGVLLSFGLYGPWNSARHLPSTQLKSSPGWLTFWTIFILWAQASNFYTHLTLRSLRPAGTKKRSIPTGYGFDTVFCANYMFESLVWIGTTIMTGSISCAVFTAVSVGQMVLWAIKKKAAYKKEFGATKGFPKGRKAIFPGLV